MQIYTQLRTFHSTGENHEYCVTAVHLGDGRLFDRDIDRRPEAVQRVAQGSHRVLQQHCADHRSVLRTRTDQHTGLPDGGPVVGPERIGDLLDSDAWPREAGSNSWPTLA